MVALAVAVCWVSNHTALRLIEQARSTVDHVRFGWEAAASFSVGAGVWSTHFIAMLGYDPGVIVGYEVERTLISLGLSVISAFIVVRLLREAAGAAVLGVGVLLGLGVAAMHYTGMAGVTIPGRLVWHVDLVVASIVAGVTLMPLALVVFSRRLTARPKLVAASILTLGITTLHFTAMAAADAVSDPLVDVDGPGLTRVALAAAIAAAMMVVLGSGVFALFAERLRASNRILQQRERELSAKTTQLDAALENMLQGLCMYDSRDRLVVFNRQFCRMFGLPAEAVSVGMPFGQVIARAAELGRFPGRRPGDIVHEQQVMVRRREPSRFRQELDGARVIEMSLTPLASGGWVATYGDISEAQRREQRISHMARHDSLTDLPNRLFFREALEAACARSTQDGPFAVHCLDLDRFKDVNDTLGHPIGDALLRAVTGRILACIGPEDVVARIGGDEFAILQARITGIEDARALARRIIEELAEPYEVCGHQVVVGVSVGISAFPADGLEPDTLVRNADVALYASKANGRGASCCFDGEMAARLQQRRLLELELRKAVAAGEFVLHYQPIIEVATSRIIAFEALLRWSHPQRGLISPAEFIPLAEEVGLIVPIGEWVLRQACAEAASWPAETRLAVNLSPGQFRSKTLVSTVISALAQSGLSAHRLELEITESALLDEGETTVRTLTRLRELGIRVAMDDFGTGYSSLGHLRSFTFDKIKIDRSFVLEMSTSVDCAAIVRAVVQLASSLGIVATAEGVETAEQLRLIRDEGCCEAQGFLISRPLPAREAARFIAARMAQANAA